jgi:hypothetical protein
MQNYTDATLEDLTPSQAKAPTGQPRHGELFSEQYNL